MRVAFAYGRYSLGEKRLDLLDPEGDPAGLTGSEWSCLALAREMARRGHETTLYLPRRRPFDVLEADFWEGVRLRELSHLRQEHHDAVCAWNEPDLLRDVHPSSVRLVNQQLNDFWYARPGFDPFVDVYTSPSESHRMHLRDQTPSPGKWKVISQGCDTSLYGGEKIPGRVVYASSPDRGLHQLLPLWPEVKKRVPHAHLRILYGLEKWFALADAPEDSVHPRHAESRRRAWAVREMLMNGVEGVELVGSVSRRRVTEELSAAVALAYPCDPYVWTEGFSMTVLEACAAGCVPVITDADALGELYGGVCPMVSRHRVGEIDREDYTELLVSVITNEALRKATAERCWALAENYTWPKVAARLEDLLS